MVTAAPTGDLNNSIHKLKTELSALSFHQPLDLDGIMRASPPSILPLLHYALLDYSQPLASYLHSRGMYDMYAKTDTRFLESVWRVCRDEFKYRPVLTRDQFLAAGKYVERKIMFVTDFLRECRKKHVFLSRNSSFVPPPANKSLKKSNSETSELRLTETRSKASLGGKKRRSAFTRVLSGSSHTGDDNHGELEFRKNDDDTEWSDDGTRCFVQRNVPELSKSDLNLDNDRIRTMDIAPSAHPVSSLQSARRKYARDDHEDGDERERRNGDYMSSRNSVREEVEPTCSSWPVRGTLWSYLVPNATCQKNLSMCDTETEPNNTLSKPNARLTDNEGGRSSVFRTKYNPGITDRSLGPAGLISHEEGDWRNWMGGSISHGNKEFKDYDPQWYCNTPHYENHKNHKDVFVTQQHQQSMLPRSNDISNNNNTQIDNNRQIPPNMEYRLDDDNTGSQNVHDSRTRPRPPPLHNVPPFETYITLNQTNMEPPSTTTTTTGSQQSSPLQRYGARALESYHHHSKIDPHQFIDGERPAERHGHASKNSAYEMVSTGNGTARLETKRSQEEREEPEGQDFDHENGRVDETAQDLLNGSGTEIIGTMSTTFAKERASTDEIATTLSRIVAHISSLNKQIHHLNDRMHVIEKHVNFPGHAFTSTEKSIASTPARKSNIPVPVSTCKARKLWDRGIEGNGVARYDAWKLLDGENSIGEKERDTGTFETGGDENREFCRENCSRTLCPPAQAAAAAPNSSPDDRKSENSSSVSPSPDKPLDIPKTRPSELHGGVATNQLGSNTGQLIQNISERFRVTQDLLRESIGSSSSGR